MIVANLRLQRFCRVKAGWIARRSRTTAAVWRFTLVALVAGLALINATGVYAQLVPALSRYQVRSKGETRYLTQFGC
jgi:hypothetical protein